MNSVNNNVINNSIIICATTSLSSPDWFMCSILFAIVRFFPDLLQEKVQIYRLYTLRYVSSSINPSVVKQFYIFISF